MSAAPAGSSTGARGARGRGSGREEELGGELAVGEEREEALHVGEPAALLGAALRPFDGAQGRQAQRAALALDAVAASGQDLAGAAEGEAKAGELGVGGLGGG